MPVHGVAPDASEQSERRRPRAGRALANAPRIVYHGSIDYEKNAHSAEATSKLPRMDLPGLPRPVEVSKAVSSSAAVDDAPSYDVLFDVSKKEKCHPKAGFKKLFRKLRGAYKCQVNKDEMAADWLAKTGCLVLGDPRAEFSEADIASLHAYVAGGGSLLVLLSAASSDAPAAPAVAVDGSSGSGGGSGGSGGGGGGSATASLNQLLAPYGIKANSDAVVGTVHYKSYHHPKDVLVHDAVVSASCQRACAEAAANPLSGKKRGGGSSSSSSSSSSALGKKGAGKKGTGGEGPNQVARTKFDIALSHGCTLSVSEGATAVLSSGAIAFPLNAAVGAVHQAKPASAVAAAVSKRGAREEDDDEEEGEQAEAGLKKGGVAKGGRASRGGRVAVLGSAAMFGDGFLEKEDNESLVLALVRWLLADSRASTVAPLEVGDKTHTGAAASATANGGVSERTEVVAEPARCPDMEALSERIRACMQDTDDLPGEFMQLFDNSLFKFDVNLIPETVGLYGTLGMKHEPLGLIPPQFECPLPPFQPAVFPPMMREPAGPSLDQFDLDEQFASERLRLAQLTNKCSEDDLEYYVRECGEVLGVTSQLQHGKASAKHVLDYVLRKLIDFKKLDNAGLHGQGMAVPEGVDRGDCRPSTAEAVNAVVDSGAMPGYRPDTASALRAVSAQDSYGQHGEDAEYAFGGAGGGQGGGQGGGDFRPDTAAALRAVQQQYDARPDTAAAIAAVMQSEAQSGVAGYGSGAGYGGGYDEKHAS
jgi:intraflagellar transport protein 52